MTNSQNILLELCNYDVDNATPKASMRQLKGLLKDQEFDDSFIENINEDTLKGFSAAITIAKRIAKKHNTIDESSFDVRKYDIDELVQAKDILERRTTIPGDGYFYEDIEIAYSFVEDLLDDLIKQNEKGNDDVER